MSQTNISCDNLLHIVIHYHVPRLNHTSNLFIFADYNMFRLLLLSATILLKFQVESNTSKSDATLRSGKELFNNNIQLLPFGNGTIGSRSERCK